MSLSYASVVIYICQHLFHRSYCTVLALILNRQVGHHVGHDGHLAYKLIPVPVVHREANRATIGLRRVSSITCNWQLAIARS